MFTTSVEKVSESSRRSEKVGEGRRKSTKKDLERRSEVRRLVHKKVRRLEIRRSEGWK